MGDTSFLPYARHSLDESDRKAIEASLCEQVVTRGPCVRLFEEELAAYVQAPYAVVFSSGSTALEAAYLAANLSSEDIVVTTPNTFVATAAPVRRMGATLQLVDIDGFGNIDCEQALQKIHEPRTRGRMFFVPVHFAGHPVDMPSFAEKVYCTDLVTIEDASHALGSCYTDGSRVGSCSHSDMTIFSFHPAKNMTTGEGGAVTCASEKIYEALLRIRNSGIERKELKHHVPSLGYYEVPVLSSNYHMTEMQAALGSSQLKRMGQFHARKKELRERYLERLQGFPGVRPLLATLEPSSHFHLFVVSIAFQVFNTTRGAFMEALEQQGIGSQYHYVPLYYHDAFGMDVEAMKVQCPMMEEHFLTALSLPFFSTMELSDVDRVVDTLKATLLHIPVPIQI